MTWVLMIVFIYGSSLQVERVDNISEEACAAAIKTVDAAFRSENLTVLATCVDKGR